MKQSNQDADKMPSIVWQLKDVYKRQGFDGVATVGIGRRTARRVRDCDGYTDNGIATLVFNDTGNGISPPLCWAAAVVAVKTSATIKNPMRRQQFASVRTLL